MMTFEDFVAYQRAHDNRRFALDSGRRVIVACGCSDPLCEGWALVSPSEAAGWNVQLGRVTGWKAFDEAVRRDGAASGWDGGQPNLSRRSQSGSRTLRSTSRNA